MWVSDEVWVVDCFYGVLVRFLDCFVLGRKEGEVECVESSFGNDSRFLERCRVCVSWVVHSVVVVQCALRRFLT